MTLHNGRPHLLRFIKEKQERSISVRIAYGNAATMLFLRRPRQFPGQMTLRCVTQVSDLSSHSAEWLEAYTNLLSGKTSEYAFSSHEDHTYIHYISRKGSLVEANYTDDELLAEVVTFAVELSFYLIGLVADSYAWRKHFGVGAAPTPEDVFAWRGSRDGLFALRKRKGRPS